MTYSFEEIMDAYLNDGYCYCMQTPHRDRFKIGKTALKPRQQNQDDVENALLKRYETYYGAEQTYIHKLVRVGDHHKAENYIKETLKSFRHCKELYDVSDKEKICKVYQNIEVMFPTWQHMLKSIDSLDERIKVETLLNKTIRALDLHLVQGNIKKSVKYAEMTFGC
jgi:hypothetical protein